MDWKEVQKRERTRLKMQQSLQYRHKHGQTYDCLFLILRFSKKILQQPNVEFISILQSNTSRLESHFAFVRERGLDST